MYKTVFIDACELKRRELHTVQRTNECVNIRPADREKTRKRGRDRGDRGWNTHIRTTVVKSRLQVRSQTRARVRSDRTVIIHHVGR